MLEGPGDGSGALALWEWANGVNRQQRDSSNLLTWIASDRFPMKRLVLGIALSLVLLGCSEKDSGNATSEKQSAADVRAGKTLAEQQCAGCHGLDGKGTAPAIPHLAGQSQRYLLASLAEYKNGKRSHAALRDIANHLSDADARNVAAYYASQPPMPASEKDAHVISPYERGKSVAAACTSCHGEDGNSKSPRIPSLAGQQPRYFVTAVQEYLMGARSTSPMHSLVRDMNRVDLDDVALFFASQTPAERAAPPTGDPAAGEPLTAVCGGCHGYLGVSRDAATPSLAGQDAQYLVAATEAYRTTRKHVGMQRAVAGLSDKDIENIAAFYSVQKSKAAEIGQRLVQDLTDKCGRCHTGSVDNPSMAIPNIAAQDRDYLVMAMRAYRDDKRQSSVMHTMSLPYSDSVIESIASYYASQPPK
jgi:cytochrome c553